ncbi:hypothetical protein GWI33_014146 [Rhynchophorus ferrugineus]|uniref:Uncharacterized protein n=1 Tax=Rhynchophorus ferrugineus TaxID=354439 RepID=A0A834I372_RHYFE|nr:hypothetical protein GWI33_014146 [Rhynchophorus ferrugineus]
MDSIFKYVEYQLRFTPINVLTQLCICINNLIASNRTEFPFASIEDLKAYIGLVWKELHRRKFRFCIQELQRPNYYHIIHNAVPLVTREFQDDPNVTVPPAWTPENVSNSSSSVTLSSYSEAELLKRDIDAVEQWLLHIKQEIWLKRSIEKAMTHFNQFRRQMVVEWLEDFDKYEQEYSESDEMDE